MKRHFYFLCLAVLSSVIQVACGSSKKTASPPTVATQTRGELAKLKKQLTIAGTVNVNELTSCHINDAIIRIDKILEYRR